MLSCKMTEEDLGKWEVEDWVEERFVESYAKKKKKKAFAWVLRDSLGCVARCQWFSK